MKAGDSLTSVGRAFHARGPATEKALSARCNLVCLTTKLQSYIEVTSFSGSQPTVITAFTKFYKVLWGDAVSNIAHQRAQFELDSTGHWKPVELFQKSYVAHVFVEMRRREVYSSNVLHSLQTVECRLLAEGKQTVTIVQTWQYQCTYQRIQCVIVNITAHLADPSQVVKHVFAQSRALACIDKCSSMYTPSFLATIDGWRTLSAMDRVRSAWLTVVACQARWLLISPHSAWDDVSCSSAAEYPAHIRSLIV